jgi:Kef-type K+ transport system membrane component KefB
MLLGPSLFGHLAPQASATLFPAQSLEALHLMSAFGLLLFMFVTGLKLNPTLLHGKLSAAIITSHIGIVVPFALGAALAVFLHPRLADAHQPLLTFTLFLGVAMSITAFPVLAHILHERDLQHTSLGSMVITCAAIDDITAWLIFAIVIGVARSTQTEIPLWLTLIGSAVFVLTMLMFVRRALQRVWPLTQQGNQVSRQTLTMLLLFVLASAWVTEWLGIHALFGAFLAGLVVPKNESFIQAVVHKIEDLTVVLLLPLFFAFTGLRTSLGLLETPYLWMYCLLIIGVAVAGKWGGSMIAARALGFPWRDAGALGVLMNTRGLMELMVLNVALDIGVITPTLFTMMVIMALVTTCMTTPLLDILYPLRRERQPTPVSS